MTSTATKQTSKDIVTVINGFEINPRHLYRVKLLSAKTGISIKMINKLMNNNEIEYKKTGRCREVKGYSLIAWLNM